MCRRADRAAGWYSCYSSDAPTYVCYSPNRSWSRHKDDSEDVGSRQCWHHTDLYACKHDSGAEGSGQMSSKKPIKTRSQPVTVRTVLLPVDTVTAHSLPPFFLTTELRKSIDRLLPTEHHRRLRMYFNTY